MKHILFCLFVCLHIVAHSADPGDGQNMLQRKKVGANGFEQEVWTWSNGTLIGRLSNGSIGSISMGNGVSLSAEGVLSATAGITSMGLSVPSGLSVSGSPLTANGTISITTALSGIIKGTGSGFTAAVAGTDYLSPSGNGSQLTGITSGQVSGLGTLATQNGTFSGTSSGTNTGDQDLSAYATSAAVASGYQPKSTVLTTYAGINPSSNIQSLLAAADYAAAKGLLSLGNVENTALSSWTGSSSITTLGTISSGTWNGSVIGAAYLGTGTPSTTTYLRGDNSWQTITAGIGGSTGSTDNAFLRADGGAGSTMQASPATMTDGGAPTFYDSLSLLKTGSSDGTTMEVINDPLNGAVRALYILPPGDSGRIYLGKAGRSIYSLDFSNVSSVTSFPSIITTSPYYILTHAGDVSLRALNAGILLETTAGGLVKFNGSTSSYPALKQVGAILQARLADDSGFTSLQGKMILDSGASPTLSTTGSVALDTTIADFGPSLVFSDGTDERTVLSVKSSALSATDAYVFKYDAATNEIVMGASGVGGSTGSKNHAVLRADGTGGSTLQSTNIVVNDASTSTARNVTIWNNHPADVSYSVTGVASTNVITAPGHNFVLYDAVTFPSLTGGTGLQPEPATYYVRDVSGNTFKVAYIDGGTAIDFTTDISAGTVELARSALVLTPKGSGALIAGYPPDGTVLGGNARGRWAVDLQLNRASADQVANGQSCVAIGTTNKAGSSTASHASVCIGDKNTASNNWSVAIGYNNNLGGGNGSVGLGYSNIAPSVGGGNVFLGYQNVVDTDRPSYNNWGSILATGSTAAVRREGVVVHSFGSWGYLKPAQHEKTGLMVETSGATPTTMTTSGGYRFNLDSDCVYDCDIKITARSAAGVSASFHRRCLIERTGNTTALVGAVQTVNTDILEDGVTWSVSITADDTNDCLKIEVTGQAATAIRWMAVIEDNELNY